MFKIADEVTFTRRVEVLVPADDGHRKESLIATYRVVPVDQLAALDLKTEEGARTFLEIAVKSLDDLVDANGKAVAFTSEVLDHVLGFSYVREALANAYFEAVSKAKAGN